MKVYKSDNTIIGISVIVGGRSKHLMFDALNTGGSVLRVMRPEIARAVERHEDFGKAFYLYSDDQKEMSVAEREMNEGVKAKEEKVGDAAGTRAGERPAADAAGTGADAAGTGAEERPAGETAGTGAGTGTGADAGNEGEDEEVKVFACFDDAREWVNEEFGVAKKKLMSKAAVIGAASDNGVKIKIES